MKYIYDKLQLFIDSNFITIFLILKQDKHTFYFFVFFYF